MTEDGFSFTPGESILKDTVAEMTYPQVQAAIERGAIALWGLGVVEQHGPHLPTGTDIYIPAARLRLVRQALAALGIEALIVPVYYWGVNVVSASFPSSYQVRPEIMVELMSDVLGSLGRDGIHDVFCVSGHGDARHNQTIFEGVTRASREGHVRAAFVAAPALFERLGIKQGDPHALPVAPPPPVRPSSHIDVHAGDWETSLMLAFHPELVRKSEMASLESTRLGPEDLAKWRLGHESARDVTPLGYFGDPASATRDRGVMEMQAEARLIAEAIAARLAATKKNQGAHTGT